ncbi:MAG TPA: ABC transporter permease [Firmicutes bacterium]|nr:ABC transporter permease [Bacillota bacterium]
MNWAAVADPAFLTGLLKATVALAAPLLAAAIGELLVERSGVLNLGLEGIILGGALGGFLGSFYGHSPWAGALSGMLVGLALQMLLAWLVVGLRANQPVTGIALTMFSQGATGFVYRSVCGLSVVPPSAVSFAPWKIPVLSALPVVGQVVFSQTPLVYVAFALVAAMWILLFRTKFGLKVRAVGGRAAAADSLGINVLGVRYVCMAIGGALAGLAGALLSLELGMFAEGMSGGRGFIVIALVAFARWQPARVLGGSLLFAFADALQLRLQALGFQLPYQFLVMLPYVLTIVVLVMAVTRGIAPTVLNQSFMRERKTSA